MAVSKVKLSLRKKQHLPQAIKYDFQPLKADSQLQEEYAVEVSKKFSALASEMDSNAAIVRDEIFLEAIKCSNEKLLGGSTTWGRSKSSFLLFMTEGSVSYQIIFTGSENIVPSQSYRISKS